MMPANVKLSKNEMQLVIDPQIILTKNIIIKKVYELFGLLTNDFRNFIKDTNFLSAEIVQLSPKIYKGEQYQELPYVMLDYPRLFSRDHVFAIRCFFWWGNFFSINLHLSGNYLERFQTRALQFAKNNEWHICINENPWEHHFETNNFIEPAKFDIASIAIGKIKFLKIAKKISLDQWDGSFDFFNTNFKNLLQALAE